MSPGRRKTLHAGEPWLTLVAAILQRAPSLAGAACRGHGRLFEARTDADRAAALALCRRCPALSDCRTWVRSLTKPPSGVVAGRYRKPWP
jgi:hypothetical protein